MSKSRVWLQRLAAIVRDLARRVRPPSLRAAPEPVPVPVRVRSA